MGTGRCGLFSDSCSKSPCGLRLGRARARGDHLAWRKPPSDGFWCSSEGVHSGAELLVSSRELPLPGHHTIINAGMVAQIGGILGISNEVIRRALLTYRGLPHRTESLGILRGRTVYNDSKATSPHATLAAIRSTPPGTIVLIGGKDKGGDFRPLMREVTARKTGSLDSANMQCRTRIPNWRNVLTP